MSATSPEEWKILPLSNRDLGPPKLLFKFITSYDGFELYITDLIHCWRDSRDRASIMKDATKSRSSIDPGEDAGQFGVLLSKLRDGLNGTKGGRCKIGSMRHGEQKNRSRCGFRVLSKTPLPEPLPPLLWTFNLFEERRIWLTRELLLPALASALKYRTQVKELRNQIDEKDHVITRLMDKMDQSSMDLSLVFPGYSTGRKGLNAQNAVKFVPGLSRFDGVGWQKTHTNDQLIATQSLVEALSMPDAHELTFEGPYDPSSKAAIWELFGTAGEWREDWMDPLEDDPIFTDDDESNNKKLHEAPVVPQLQIEESTSAFEDVLQAGDDNIHRPTDLHQPWIPHCRSQGASSTPSGDSPPRFTRSTTPRAGHGPPARSTGTQISQSRFSSHSASSASPESDSSSSSPQTKPPKPSKLGNLGGGRKGRLVAVSAQSASPPLSLSRGSTPSRKLGVIGGTKSPVQHLSSPVPPHWENQAARPQHTPARKLGVLGGHHKSSPTQQVGTASKQASLYRTVNGDLDSSDSHSPSPSPSGAFPSTHPAYGRKQVVESPHERNDEPATAEEMADRKREELKRTLEVGDAKRKKKRKF